MRLQISCRRPMLTEGRNLEESFVFLIHEATVLKQTATHQVAAWNVLCAVLDRCSQHEDDDIRRAIAEEGWWARAFVVYLRRAQLARPKSAKQLLATLTTVFHRCGADGRLDRARSTAVLTLIGPLLNTDDHSRAKTCALALAHFLGKGVISIDNVIQQYRAFLEAAPKASRLSDEECLENLLCHLFSWMGRADFGSIVGQLVSNILDKVDDPGQYQHSASEPAGSPIWTSALKRATSDQSIDVATLRVHLLPMLFKRGSDDYCAFLKTIGLQTISSTGEAKDHSTFDLLCASLQAGSALGMLMESDGREICFDEGVVHVPTRQIARLLQRTSPTARLTGLSLLITSRTATRPLSPAALKAIARNLSHFFADTDANFRSDVFGLIQRLIDRIRAITAVMARQASNSEVGAQAALGRHTEFLHWLLRFLQWQLRPTASYQRHISALKCLSVIARSGLDDDVVAEDLSKSALGETKWPMRIHILTADLRSLLLDRVMDPFDDVRQLASALLILYPSGDSGSQADISLAIGRAQDMMLASSRADQADGLAHLNRLLYAQKRSDGEIVEKLIAELEEMVRVAQANLSQAVARYPVHGLLTSLRYIIECNQQILAAKHGYFERMVDCLQGIWCVVKPVLCDDAPEGFVPEEAGDVETGSTKDTLSYCWRALKESSMLLSSLLPRADFEQAQELSELCFTQLAELRHRGAFSTVAQTWVACCLNTHELPAPEGQLLLQQWYAKVISILQGKKTINTRRSAGLPSLICGILIAERDGQLLWQAFTNLESIARQPVAFNTGHEGSLPQVHAMNCMKDILKNSRLGEASEQYVPLAMTLAADALRSPAWVIRNCGLMLFRAVIDRLLGTNEAHSDDDSSAGKQLSVEQYPQLLEVVLGLIGSTSADSGAQDVTLIRSEGVFPALQLLQRLAVPADQLDAVLEAVEVLLANPSWHVRDKAARTYASLVDDERAGEELHAKLQTSIASQNGLHGELLCAKYLWRKLSAPARKRRHIVAPIKMLALTNLADAVCCVDELYHGNPCPVTKAAYIDLVTEIMEDVKSHDVELLAAHACLSLGWVISELHIHAPGDGSVSTLRLALVRLLACQMMFAAEAPPNLGQRVRRDLLDLQGPDGDAVAAFFRKVDSMVESGHQPSQDAYQIILDVCQGIINTSDAATQLHYEALQTLLRLTKAHTLQHNEHGARTIILPGMPKRSSQQYMDLHLEWRAAQLEHTAHSQGIVEGRNAREVHDFVSCCLAAMRGTGAYSREAVAKAMSELGRLYDALLDHAELAREVFGLYLTAYDLLNDDDEDIRLLAAMAASRILAAGGSPSLQDDAVPAVAVQRLTASMIRQWPMDHEFADEVIRRSFGDLKLSVAVRRKKLMASNTTLFAEEKQNLYVDDAGEAKAWSQALMRLSPTVVPRSAIMKLSHWTTDGLHDLATNIKDHGPLGSSSDPQLFKLGLQVVYGAEYLLHLSGVGKRLPIQPSVLRHQLAEVVDVQSTTSCHCLWQREVERVLAGSVRHKLTAVYTLLQGMNGKLLP